ncbi:MAG: hypothetical protein QM778_31685 [Myxococcales bacterium]
MSETAHQTPPREPKGSRSRQHRVGSVLPALSGLGLCLLALPSAARAQTWSDGRTAPTLREIVAVDPSGEPAWPFGSEDVAGDANVFAADEASTDVRTMYADSDAQRLWLRAYVVSPQTSPANLAAYFFIDTDDNDATGGPASGGPGWPAFRSDPMAVGYERAIAMRVEAAPMLPSVIGAWNWNGQAWVDLKPKKDDVRAETGIGEDPLRVGPRTHAFLQMDAVHAITGLDASCGGNLLLRTYYEQPGTPRAFGDDTKSGPCRPALDTNGDPTVIHVQCTNDAQCPNDGRCRDGVCLFAYACNADVDCQAGERCTANACVKVVDRTCTDASQCDGLVCENGMCVACAESGARACASGYACSPDGSCVNTGPIDMNPMGNEVSEGEVRGGAFKCSALPGARAGDLAFACLSVLGLAAIARRRRHKRGEGNEGRQS